MSIITCPECKKEISDKAISCPNCGYVLNPQTSIDKSLNQNQSKSNLGCVKPILGSVLILLLFSLIFGAINSCDDENITPTVENLENEDKINVEEQSKIDSLKIKELKSKFISNVDKYEGKEWIQHVNQPKYRNQNAFYCYFQKQNDIIGNFRFVVQYYDDNWLFIEKLTFLIDGTPIDYVPLQFKKDNDSNIWEWSDEKVSKYNESLIKAISYAKKVEVKLHGSKYYDERKLSEKTITQIRETYEYYKALGGEF